VWEVEQYQLDIVGLTSTHSAGSGTKLLEMGWTLFFSGVSQAERRRAGVGILTSPRVSAAVLEFAPENERVAGSKALTVFFVLMHQTVQSIRPSWSRWEGSWRGHCLPTP